jgi:hypothetical protein
MNFITHLFQLLSENKVDELIAYVEENDFPPKEWKFEEGVLSVLEHLREVIDRLGPSAVEKKTFYPIKESVYEFPAKYADLHFCTLAGAFEAILQLDQASQVLGDTAKKLQTKMRLARKREKMNKRPRQSFTK